MARDDHEQLLGLVDYWTPLTMRILMDAKLGDALADGAQPVAELAARTG